MRELLELHTMIPGPTRLGIEQELIVAKVVQRVDNSLDLDDIGKYMHSVVSIADELDDVLIEKYGGTSIQPEE